MHANALKEHGDKNSRYGMDTDYHVIIRKAGKAGKCTARKGEIEEKIHNINNTLAQTEKTSRRYGKGPN